MCDVVAAHDFEIPDTKPEHRHLHHLRHNYRLRAPRIIIGDLVDPGRDWLERHRIGRVGVEGDRLAVEPGVEGVGGQNHRHAVVDGGQRLVRRRGQYRATLHRVPRRPFGQRARQLDSVRDGPAFPEAGERHQSAVVQSEVPGLPDLALALPLVEPVRRDQATPGAVGRPKRGLARGRFRSRVDHPVTDVRFAAPERNQAPTQHREPAAVLRRAHRRLVLAGRDIVARPQVQGRTRQVHEVMNFPPGKPLGKASAHGSASLPTTWAKR